jgi:hypothetical protein
VQTHTRDEHISIEKYYRPAEILEAVVQRLSRGCSQPASVNTLPVARTPSPLPALQMVVMDISFMVPPWNQENAQDGFDKMPCLHFYSWIYQAQLKMWSNTDIRPGAITSAFINTLFVHF